MDGVNVILQNTFNNTFETLAAFIPRFVSGLIVLLIGIIVATFVRQLLLEIFKFIRLNTLLKRYGVPEAKEGVNWAQILAEIARWFVLILFLIPTSDIWGLGRFGEILNGLLLFLPNVFISILLLIVGFVIARLVYDLILASVHGLSRESAKTVALVGRWAVLIFVFLVVLNQLGIASDLIRILFGGIVAMVALAGGLAFGLGGQDTAREILQKIKKKF